MLKKIILSLSLMSCPLVVLADQIKLNENAPKTHVVEKGDTLWDISAVFLEQPWLWPKLWRLNPEVNNPHLIYPGDILKLVYDESGEPMLVVDVTDPTKNGKNGKQGKPSYKWSPKIRQENTKNSAITLLPLEVIAPYMTYGHVFSNAELAALPHVIGSNEGYRMTIKDFKVYVNSDLKIAQSYAIYNKGEELFDPETDKSLGFYVTLVGTGQVLKTGDMENKVPATLNVGSVKREIKAGSYIVPINEDQLLPSVFSMKAANESLRGSIVKAISDARGFGKLEIILINRGAEDDVTAGDVMTIKRTSPGVVETDKGPVYLAEASRWDTLTASDYKMPEEDIGDIMVFKVFEKTSMAIILNSITPARISDIVSAPES